MKGARNLWMLVPFFRNRDMENQEEVKSLLELIFEQDEMYKFIVGVFIIFILPPIINIINTSIKNKSLRDFMKTTNSQMAIMSLEIQMIKEKVNMMFNDNVEEASLAQLESIFRGRVSIDIDLLVKGTKQIIVINHIDNKEVTKRKVETVVKTVYSNTAIVLDQFKRNGVEVSTFMKDEWRDIIVLIIYTFIYSVDEKKAYRFDNLKYQLKGQFDTFIVEYINDINNK